MPSWSGLWPWKKYHVRLWRREGGRRRKQPTSNGGAPRNRSLPTPSSARFPAWTVLARLCRHPFVRVLLVEGNAGFFLVAKGLSSAHQPPSSSSGPHGPGHTTFLIFACTHSPSIPALHTNPPTDPINRAAALVQLLPRRRNGPTTLAKEKTDRRHTGDDPARRQLSLLLPLLLPSSTSHPLPHDDPPCDHTHGAAPCPAAGPRGLRLARPLFSCFLHAVQGQGPPQQHRQDHPPLLHPPRPQPAAGTGRRKQQQQQRGGGPNIFTTSASAKLQSLPRPTTEKTRLAL